MRSLRDRLQGIHRGARESPNPTNGPEQPHALPDGFEEVITDKGTAHVREQRCPSSSIDASAVRDVLPFLLPAEKAPYCVSDMLFLDLETTGLSRGVGTVPFLTGVAYQDGEGIVIRQFLLRDPAGEPAYLEIIAETIRERPYLVTFNGRSFDLPILDARYMLNRMARPKTRGHYDLLHPARRLWGALLASCRLSYLQEHLLYCSRDNDIPGSEIPGRYFDYLSGGPASVLDDVIAHNGLDLLAMVGLIARMAKPLQGEGHWHEHMALARAAADIGQPGASATQTERALKRAGDDVQYFQTLRLQADLHRRTGGRPAGVPTWMLMISLVEAGISVGSDTVLPYIQMAKFAEHDLGDHGRALAYTRRAIQRIHASNVRDMALLEELEHREGRLIGRLRRTFPAACRCSIEG